MHANSARIAVAREWFIKAENDLKNAAHTLKLGRKCPTDTVGFHAQQCVVKYLKAFLVCHKGRVFADCKPGTLKT
jgi:HEPN domain-containing protein